MKQIIGGFAALVLLGGAAHAGGPVVSHSGHVFDWSGFYLGAHVGAGKFSSDVRDDNYKILDAAGMSVITQGNDALYGLQIGYNKQFGSAVLGIEADYTWTKFDAARTLYEEDYTDVSTDWKGFGTVRARLGLAHNNALVYVTGGLAYFDVKQVASYDDGEGGDYTVSFKGDLGFAAGAGAEFMLKENFSLKLEYLYLSAGEERKVCGDCDLPQFANNEAHTVRVGFNYKLGRRDAYVPLK
jgi:outer membrane immunogenic protein